MEIFFGCLMQSMNPNQSIHMFAFRLQYNNSALYLLYLNNRVLYFNYVLLVAIINTCYLNIQNLNLQINKQLSKSVNTRIKQLAIPPNFNNPNYNNLEQILQQETTMKSKSQYIKSKKQKIGHKKQQKFREKQYKNCEQGLSNLEIIDLSSQQQKSKKNLEDVKHISNGSHDSKIVNVEPKYNNFDIKKLTKLMGPLKPAPQPTILQIQQNYQGINESNNINNKTITYKKVGINLPKQVCQNYLKQRLQKIPEQSTLIEQNNQQKQLQKGSPERVLRRRPRYFDEDISESEGPSQNQDEPQHEPKKSVKCYRCGLKGHIARACNMAEILRCVYCLGSHHSSQCQDKLCHKCNQKGHIKQNCRSDKIQCHRCRGLGHISKNCGKIIMMNFQATRQKQITERYQKQDLQKLKCLKCNGTKDSKGHFNCKAYPKTIPIIYNQPYLID